MLYRLMQLEWFLYHIYISDTNADLIRRTGLHSRGFLLTSMLIIKRLLWENSFAMQLRGEKEGRDWWRGSEGRDRVRETEKHRGGHVWRKGEKGPERDRMIHFTSQSQLSYSVRAEGLCWSLVPCTEQAIANFIKDVISTRDLKDVSPQPSV